MGRISTYNIDAYVIGQDRWIGSSWETPDKLTKNFTADAVAEYFNRVSIIDTGQFSWDFIPYNNTQEQPAKTFMKVDWLNDTININNFAGVLRVSSLTLGNTEPGAFIENEWVGNNILVHVPGNPSAYSVYTVDSLIPDGQWYYFMTLSFVNGESFLIQKNEPIAMGYFANPNVIEGVTATFPLYSTGGTIPNIYLDETVRGEWDLAYDNSIVSASVTGTTTKTLTLTQQDGGTIQASWDDEGSNLVTSVFGRTGAIVAVSGDYNTSQVTESTNLYFTQARAIASPITGYNPVAGTITASDTILTAINKLSGNISGGYVPYTGAINNVNLGEKGITAGYVGFDLTPTATPTGVGTMYWDSAYRTVALIDGDGDTTLQIGQEERILVHNNTGSTLTDGQVVYVTGSTGNLPSVSLADASSETTSAATLGVVTESIANGADGFVTVSGIVNGLNTLAFTEGDLLWLSETAGQFTNVKPISPAHLVLVGYVIKKAGGNGSILVKIQNTQELSESSDVLISAPEIDGQGLFLQTISGVQLWRNRSISDVIGGSPITGSGTVNYVPKFDTTSSITDSNIQDSGTLITLGSDTYINGLVGIGINPVVGFNLAVQKNITGAAVSHGIGSYGQIQSDVSTARYFISTPSQASGATTGSIQHYFATQGVFSGTVTSQIGFYVNANLTGATSNFGFRGDIASGTNRWNIYMAGTANNYLAGDTSIGTTTLGTATKLTIGGSETAVSAIARGQLINPTLVASANNDVLVGLDIAPTFTTGAFTGVSNIGLRLAGDIQPSVNNTYALGASNRKFYVLWTNLVASAAANLTFATTNNIAQFNGTTGNLTLQNGGTFTDAGYRLDVFGTTRFTGTTASDTAPLGAELAGVTGTGTGWTLVGTNLNVGGYDHTPGDTTPLTTTLAAVSGTYYQITYTITNRTAGSVSIGYGGVTVTSTTTGATGPIALSTAPLVITPTTDFDGNVVISIKSIGISSASSTFSNSAGGSRLEFRATTAGANTIIGTSSGRRITTGSNNTFFGTSAGANHTTGINNVLIGVSAGAAQTTASNNTFIGYGAGDATTTGNNNTFLGINSGSNNTTGALNVFIGVQAGDSNTTGSSNVAIGQTALSSANVTGSTAVGHNSLRDSTGVSNTAFGYHTFLGLVAGANNTSIGHLAGRYFGGSASNALTQADNTTLVGYNAMPLANAQTNQIVIGYSAVGLGSNTTVLGNTSTTLTALYGAVITGGTSINASAQLQVDSTTKGFLPPRMTAAQRTAIASPATGLIVYQTDGVEGLWVKTSTTWRELTVV